MKFYKHTYTHACSHTKEKPKNKQREMKVYKLKNFPILFFCSRNRQLFFFSFLTMVKKNTYTWLMVTLLWIKINIKDRMKINVDEFEKINVILIALYLR